MPLPSYGFDPTEAAIPWKKLKDAGHKVIFASPNGERAKADERILTGEDLPPFLRKPLMATHKAVAAYEQMALSREFLEPISYDEIKPEYFHGILLAGGHDKGMREYLESDRLKEVILYFFEMNLPVGAICHGTLLVARCSQSKKEFKSVLFGRKTTGLTKNQEVSAYMFTRLWLGDYYRTYDTWLQDEVCSYLASPTDFLPGPGFPIPTARDSERNLRPGFAVRDGNYVSARWPGDVHKFMHDYLGLLKGEAALGTKTRWPVSKIG